MTDKEEAYYLSPYFVMMKWSIEPAERIFGKADVVSDEFDSRESLCTGCGKS